MLCAHLDTVGTSDMTIPPFEPTIDGGCLYGRGSYDMKGAAAAAMCAAAALAGTPFQGRLKLKPSRLQAPSPRTASRSLRQPRFPSPAPARSSATSMIRPIVTRVRLSCTAASPVVLRSASPHQSNEISA